MPTDLKQAALDYHEFPTRGKLQISATKPLATQRDLALAYSPGVAFACEEIAQDPSTAMRMTARGNLVAVISNGTAVLGLGNIGPLASKPVMEGKAVLFKKFSGIDVFDIEVAETEPDMFVEAVARLEPTFGGINLEDIKAPECFEIENKLRERMNIPVFHDDQHGTAIVNAAAVLNALDLVDKNLADMRIVCNGAGAAALACLDLLVSFGADKDNIIICDREGVIHRGRTSHMDPYKARYAADTPHRSLAEAMDGADIFLGLSAGKMMSGEMAAAMAPNPLILALANPEPEIRPEAVEAVRDDAIIATGRSDYPNQVNNVLCFPFLFRGALDVGATTINEEMKQACAKAIAALARVEASDLVLNAYGADSLVFGRDYIIPKPFDPRLITEVPVAVAKAAMESGVATYPITDFETYREQLGSYVFKSGLVMKPVFDHAKRNPKRLIFAEGERVRVLQAAQQVIGEGLARPILIGNRALIDQRIRHLGLKIRPDRDFELVDPNTDSRLETLAEEYHHFTERRGVTPAKARRAVRTRSTALGALLLKRGDADAMLCGTLGDFHYHLNYIDFVIGRQEGVKDYATLSGIVMPSGTFFLADTYVNYDPSAEQLCDMTLLAAEQVRRFGIRPKVALLSHSNFGSGKTESAERMRSALKLLWKRAPDLEIEGEMHADAALRAYIREEIFPNSKLKGTANLLIMPGLDSANIAFNLLKSVGGGVPISPILLGADAPVHVVTPSVTVRGLVNMSAIAVVGAQMAS